MCTVCGCGSEGETHVHDQSHDHSHDHSHGHHHYGHGGAGLNVVGFSQNKLIEIEKNILSKNDGYAESNRHWLNQHGLAALNLVSSPGAGKTTLLVETLLRIKNDFSVGVIEGDQETANDADRIKETGVAAIQINTGKGCHLDAHMVGHAIQALPLNRDGVVFIENVGNLVCPASFDLGEDAKVVILSTTEGEDKPIKYPDMFSVSDLMLISKTDLLPYLDFNVDQAIDYAKRVNPNLEIILLSAKSGEGMEAWINWISSKRSYKQDVQADRHEQSLNTK
ncbi:MAG: hydrogenase nickel incorporation protein HypB [Pseudomonadales bacterium]|nr:hydrogenase nickel incorporation protein HypB [Pseudomonadales bacterium]